MLIDLHLKDVGPATELSIAFKPRMNFITGDNGLGKSFLLDVAWWTMTRTWARGLVVPHRPPSTPHIRYRYTRATGTDPYDYTSTYNREAEHWSVRQGRPPIPGMVIYAQVDGGFSVWDPVRNYWKTRNEQQDRPEAYHFAPHEVWYGNNLCEGLVRDWASWQRERGEAFTQLTDVLARLSPPGDPITPGELRRVFVTDPKDYPTVRMPYGQDIPVIHASAGMRRILALAYLLVWSWRDHQRLQAITGTRPAREIIFLVDEIESHLNPRWQRRIIPTLLDVMEALTGDRAVPVQLITVTHSPLVLASTEPHFDPDTDAIFTLDLDAGRVTLDEFPWSRQGDADAWLTSDIFDLREPRSLEAEDALTRADALLVQPAPDPTEVNAVEQALRATLSETDDFWPRWTTWRRGH